MPVASPHAGTDVIVIGAGFVGLNVAHALMDRGHGVTLIDPGGEPGRPSEGNAGWIAHTDIMPLASPKAWRHLPRWLADPLGPLTIRPAYLPRLVPWLVRFAAASRPSRIAAGIAALRSIQAEALPAWRRRMTGLSLAHHLRERGTLTVFTDARHLAEASDMLARQRGYAIALDVLDRAALSRLEPALGPKAVGGVLYPDACHVGDPRLLLADLHAAARARGMAEIRGRAVRVAGDGMGTDGMGAAVTTDDGRTLTAPWAVIAAGAWSRPLAASVGDRIPLDTERGYNATFPPGRLGLSRPASFEGLGFVTTPLDTGDRVGGAVEFAGLTAPPNHQRVGAMLAKLRALLPDTHLSEAEGATWMGFRPSIPDSLPVIGASGRAPRVLHAFGHGHYGLTQSAVTGEMIAAMVLGERPSVDPAPFRPSRFGR